MSDKLHGITLRLIENAAANQKEAEILIYDRIGQGWFEDGVTAKGFAKELKALGDVKTLRVRINSPGGAVSEGTAIYNTLREHPAKVLVSIDGIALSIASVIAMAGDEVSMANNALLMIHDPRMYTGGTAADMRKAADLLDKVKENIIGSYARTKKETAEISQLMSDETWLTAAEAKAHGFVDQVTGALQVAALAAPDNLHVPERFAALFSNAATPPILDLKEPETMAENKAEVLVTATAIRPELANYEQLVAGCVGADPKFICEQLAAKATLVDAQAAWMKAQNAHIAAAKAETETTKTELATAKAAKPGVAPLTNGKATPATGEGEGDPVQQWHEAVAAHIKAGLDKTKALQAASRANPELHDAYIVAHNAKLGRKVA